MPNRGCIQAEIYRAPEVILDAGYSYRADIWSVVVIVRLEVYCYHIKADVILLVMGCS